MIRVNMIVEGQTEEAFTNQVLVEHFAERGIYCSVRCVTTSSKGNKDFKGGVAILPNRLV